jgi:hypothetical protein
MPRILLQKHTCIVYDAKEVMLKISFLTTLGGVNLGHDHLCG